MNGAPGYELRAVTHLIRPWGEAAHDLDQLREGIAVAPVEVIFHHALQYQLRHQSADELPPDDFSAWISGVVQDQETGERLYYAVQSRNTSAESVRMALLEILDSVPAKKRKDRDAPEGCGFPFLSSTPVQFSMGIVVHDGHELMEALLAADASVWFHHILEDPWFRAGPTPLLEWLATTRDHRLEKWIEDAAHGGLPIGKARAQLMKRWRQSRIARQITEAAASPADERREVARQAVASFVRRATRPGETP